MSKTLLEWCSSLISPYKEIACEYLKKEGKENIKVENFSDAIWSLNWFECTKSTGNIIDWKAIARHQNVFTHNYQKYLKNGK